MTLEGSIPNGELALRIYVEKGVARQTLRVGPPGQRNRGRLHVHASRDGNRQSQDSLAKLKPACHPCYPSSNVWARFCSSCHLSLFGWVLVQLETWRCVLCLKYPVSVV